MSQISTNSAWSACWWIESKWFLAIRPQPTKAKRILRLVRGVMWLMAKLQSEYSEPGRRCLVAVKQALNIS